jgi:uncharacterized membrane protein YphA (DoxX/SURF4 family)
MRDHALLLLRIAWSVGLLLVSGAGLRKARSGAAGTAPMIASLGAPFTSGPEIWAGAAMSAELVIPFFIFFGFMSRFAALIGGIHFAVATYAHLVIWQQPANSVVFSESDPSGVGSLWWMAACLVIVWHGSGRFSLDQRIADGPGDTYSLDKEKGE